MEPTEPKECWEVESADFLEQWITDIDSKISERLFQLACWISCQKPGDTFRCGDLEVIMPSDSSRMSLWMMDCWKWKEQVWELILCFSVPSFPEWH
jgi:hypothetical protein